ncbi:MAG: hypothetical protein AAF902_02340 [Chloroflexota bacterium]
MKPLGFPPLRGRRRLVLLVSKIVDIRDQRTIDNVIQRRDVGKMRGIF